MATWIYPLIPHNVRNAIDWLQIWNAQDHDELVSEHFIYAHDTTLLFLAHILNELCSILAGQSDDV